MSQGKPATQFGVQRGQKFPQNDFKATRDREGIWQGSESFICHIDSSYTLLPKVGTACDRPSWNFLKCTEVDVENNSGDTDKVTVMYKGVDSSYTGGGDGEFTFEAGETDQYSLRSTAVNEPILSHKIFKEVTDSDKQVLVNIISGNLQPKTSNNLSVWVDSNNPNESLEYTLTGEKAKLAAKKILAGIIEPYQPSVIFERTWTSKKVPSGLSATGKISVPPNAPPGATTGGRNWLCIGCEYDSVASDSNKNPIYRCRQLWQLSGPGGWDPDLYGNS